MRVDPDYYSNHLAGAERDLHSTSREHLPKTLGNTVAEFAAHRGVQCHAGVLTLRHFEQIPLLLSHDVAL